MKELTDSEVLTLAEAYGLVTSEWYEMTECASGHHKKLTCKAALVLNYTREILSASYITT